MEVSDCRICEVHGQSKSYNMFILLVVFEIFFIFEIYHTATWSTLEKESALALSCELFPQAFLPLEHLPAAQISCVSDLQRIET